MISKETVKNLLSLSRLKAADAEISHLQKDIESILGYVSDIENVGGKRSTEPALGAVHTVMRDDGAPHETGNYTEKLLRQAPQKERNYFKVKKIL